MNQVKRVASLMGCSLFVFLGVIGLAAPSRPIAPSAIQIPPERSEASDTNRKLDQILADDISVSMPPHPCALASMTTRIALAIEMPAGIETVPGPCDLMLKPRSSPHFERVPLTGLTARSALDQLIKLYPQYRWIESNGMLVMRPLAAWNEASHFLHRTAASFHLEAESFVDALHAVLSALGAADHRGGSGRTPQGRQPISIHLESPTSAYEALNSIARRHGALIWAITYCDLNVRVESSTFSMRTFDGSGLSVHPFMLLTKEGQTFDACSRQR